MQFSHEIIKSFFLRAEAGIITGRSTGTGRLRSLRCAAVSLIFILMTGNVILSRMIS